MIDQESIFRIWAKTDTDDIDKWHPLLLHMLDVAATAEAILGREPKGTRDKLASCLGMDWPAARPWLLLSIACHDLGKACPGFQRRWEGAPRTGLREPSAPNTDISHGFVGQIALSDLLNNRKWASDLAELMADAVGCHHGSRASERDKGKARMAIFLGRGDRLEGAREDWTQARALLFGSMANFFDVRDVPSKQSLSGPEFMFLAGLTSFADWIGSNTDWFPFGIPDDCRDLPRWFHMREECAKRALDDIGWEPRVPLSLEPTNFEKAFNLSPRPLQEAMARVLADRIEVPAIILLEAPMGEGKTEAAFLAHLELQRRFEHRGLYVALPTKATGNAMFGRTLEFLSHQGFRRKLDLQLLHGAALLSDAFRDLRFKGIYDATTGGEVRASEWFTHKKRALLSEYGVGTVDQALMPILPVRHNFVRLWGLANRVIIFDEVHAYDTYTGTLLVHLLSWLLAMGSSIVLLSATLSPSVRHKLAEVAGAKLPDLEADYPRLSVFQHGSAKQTHFPPDPTRRRILRLLGISSDLSGMVRAVDKQLAEGGTGLMLVNTVQRAQELFGLFPQGRTIEHDGEAVGKRLPDETEVYLFHARFPAGSRQKRENCALETFGKDGARTGRKILIATQVAEQSLDLDFDLIATDLAPVDLVLQRAGRLWRHERKDRPVREPVLMLAGLASDQPPSFGSPLWWGSVYREDILIRSWIRLKEKHEIVLPDEIDSLVRSVYEESIEVPESLRERLEIALESCEGDALALKGQAHQAIIGLPDDASWNQPERFLLYDEDEPGVHRTLLARTRLGEESVVAIALAPDCDFHHSVIPDDITAKRWYMNAISVSRRGIVSRLRALGVPDGWKKAPLLRNCFPMVLGADFRWIEDPLVRLDRELGLVYENKEH